MKIIHRCIIGILAAAVIALLGVAISEVKETGKMREDVTAMKKQKKELQSAIKSEKEALEKLKLEAGESGIEPDAAGQGDQQTDASQDTPPTEGNGKKVAIDPGHQGYQVDMSDLEPVGPGSQQMKAKATQGTEGRFTGVPEYVLNFDISKQLEGELQKRGYEVMLTRQDHETAISNRERALLAADFGADIYVRIHANGSDDPSVSGAMTMVPSENNPYIAQLHDKSKALGEAVINAYCQSCGIANKGVTVSDDMSGTNWSQMPVIILEMGFMTNQSDDTNMQNAGFQAKMVQGIADGIDQYFAAGN